MPFTPNVPFGASITSADIVFFLTIPGVYTAPVQIVGFSPDDVVDIDSRPLTEAHLGVDGHLSIGYVKHARKMTIHLAADSPSQEVFDNWASAMDSANTAIAATGVIQFPGNGTEYNLVNGAFTNYHDMPNAKKTLQPQSYEITWESIAKVNI
jgi:hypothetical protein